MMIAVIAITSLIFFIIILSHIMTDKQEELRIYRSQSLLDGFSKEIFFASEAQPGYVRTINPPKTLEGVNYVIKIDSNDNVSIMELDVGDSTYIKVVPGIAKNFVFDSSSSSSKIIILKTNDELLVEVS